MKTQTEILNQLPKFTGAGYSQQYMSGYRITRGITWLAESAECYWLLDSIIATDEVKCVREEKFQIHKLKVNLYAASAVLLVSDRNERRLFAKSICFTDFPLNEITLWVVDKTIMLPAEYKTATLKPAFRLGRTVATPGAVDYAKQHSINVSDLLYRHEHGDGGDLPKEDIQTNEDAIARGDSRVFSSYNVGPDRLWIITEWDRSYTTVLLPSEY